MLLLCRVVCGTAFGLFNLGWLEFVCGFVGCLFVGMCLGLVYVNRFLSGFEFGS